MFGSESFEQPGLITARCSRESRVPIFNRGAQLVSHRYHLFETFFYFGQLRGGHLAHLAARSAATIALSQDARQLVEREPDTESAPHQKHTVKRLGGILTITVP